MQANSTKMYHLQVSDEDFTNDYFVTHVHKNEDELMYDWEKCYDAATNLIDWNIQDIIELLKKQGWIFVDVPTVKVSY
jgi:hypothetical protein